MSTAFNNNRTIFRSDTIFRSITDINQRWVWSIILHEFLILFSEMMEADILLNSCKPQILSSERQDPHARWQKFLQRRMFTNVSEIDQ
jgi:hypothetical protein